jgi:hypothetical protein
VRKAPNYKRFLVKGRDWREIIEFYKKLDLRPMTKLAEEIASSKYAHGIFATTSLSTLCVSQNQEFEFDRNMLRIIFSDNKFVFNYKESPHSKNEWTKECENNEGFSTFEHIMKRLKWFLD